ncbi:putative protease [Staphylococcus piscifermentans]|uniref:Uncharacterized protein n=1 Tax=Staphylococcus piscifermentans TaxID=70258 RepID=A0A239UJC4_9STAP|nr:putative mucin/carbohydrate-binding domain-containing protein [Staphylococcus piscifermentans]GEP85334.1 hypothetical protein SPI02_19190 [Staphylococcus piscifermentans]SNV10005.1 putative protease [Staphylococcus piscifermentans]
MYQQHSNKLSSKGERKNKYHIRKFSAGIASVLFGSLVYINSGNIAEAAENEINQTASTGNPSQSTMVEQPNDKLTAENNDNATQNSQAVKSQETPIDEKLENKKDTTVNQPIIKPRAVPETSSAAHLTVAAPSAPVEAKKTTYHAPAPEANATTVAPIEGIKEQVYSKEVDYYPASKVAKTAEQQRGIYQARESLGLIVPAGKNFYIRQAQGSNQTDLRVDLMTDDSPLIRNANVSKNGKWTHISTTTDSTAFLRIPAGLNKKPVVEYYVEGDSGITLPTFRKNGNQQEFVEDWKKRDTSYGYVDGDKIAFLIPRIDLERIANLGAKPGRYSFHSLEEMIEYYEDIINHYDRWVGLNDDINSIHYNVPHKYFTIADKRGFGLAYYSTNNMGSNSPSMYGYLEKGWLSLHEVGHGYDGAMTGDGKMELIEVENNILANQYQTTVMGINDGWLYEGRQDKVQKGIHDRIIKANGTFKFGGSGFRDRLDFMTKMVRLTGIDGFTDLWKGIREEEAALTKLNKPFNQDVPRWINTFWLAEHGVNGTAYFDLYNIPITQDLKNELSTYNNSFAYPLAMLIDNPEEQKRLKEKLNLSSIYELVKSADLADTELSSNAEIILNLNGQTLPADVKVSLLEGGKEVTQAKVEDGKAVFPAVKPGVYKIAAPLSLDNALPVSQYLIVREKGDNQAILDYPKHNTTQAIMTQRISLRGLGNSEFAYVDYNPEKKTVKFVQNSGQPHLYFSDEYVHLKIEKADGTVLLDESFVGNHNLKSKVQDFNLEYGDKITVRHRE